MNIYQFTNKLDNSVKRWPRCFVAISLSEAQEIAKEWCDCVNEANGNHAALMFTFDMDNVIIVAENVNKPKGYIELDGD